MGFVYDEPKEQPKVGGFRYEDGAPAQVAQQPPAPPAPAFQPNELQRRMGIKPRLQLHQDDPGGLGYNLGGRVADFGASRGLTPEAAGVVGTAANFATEAIPAFAGGIMGTASKVPAALEGTAKWLMGKALKAPVSAIETGQAARAIDTMLKEGYGLTQGSVSRAGGTIDDLGKQIKAALADAPETIRGGEVGTRLLDAYNRFLKQANPQDDLAAIRTAWANFKSHPALEGRFSEIPVQLAHEIKQGTYKALEGKFGELGSAATEAQKALARGLRELVGKAKPTLEPMLAKQGEHVNARELMAHRVAALSKIDPMSIGWMAANPLAAFGYAMEKSSPIKAFLANAIYRNRMLPRELGAAAGAIPGATAGLPPEEQ